MQPLLAAIVPIDIKPVNIIVAVELVLALLAAGRAAHRCRAAHRDPLSDPDDPGWAGAGPGDPPGARPPACRAGARARLPALPAAAPLLGCLLHLAARPGQTFARPIGLLAVGLVLATTLIVAVIVHTLAPAIPWAVAFLLGAVVSPPDAVAATSIAQRLGPAAPRRDHPGGRVARERRHGPGRLPPRAGGGGKRYLLARRRGDLIRGRERRRRGHRPDRRLGDHRGPGTRSRTRRSRSSCRCSPHLGAGSRQRRSASRASSRS